jgi:uncharacterized membrane protein
MKKRIWELDAFRGICILGMVLVHFVYDLVELYGIIDWQYPQWFSFVKDWGGVLFLLISGISATLGSRSVRRGLIVFACGMVVSAVTYGMYKLDFTDKSIIIYFGVLQCLGSCMLLWPVFKKLPWWALVILSIPLIWLGIWMRNQAGVDTKWLMPLGLPWQGFVSSDYFPLLPNFGYFLLGAAIGRTAYRKKESLLPKVNAKSTALRFLCGCGKQSLWIYLLHQPILSGLCMLMSMTK